MRSIVQTALGITFSSFPINKTLELNKKSNIITLIKTQVISFLVCHFLSFSFSLIPSLSPTISYINILSNFLLTISLTLIPSLSPTISYINSLSNFLLTISFTLIPSLSPTISYINSLSHFLLTFSLTLIPSLFLSLLKISYFKILFLSLAQSTGAVEYTDCFSAEG